MPTNLKNKNTIQTLRTIGHVKADDSGSLPTEIEVLRTGMWETPWHGNFMVTPQDLAQYCTNFSSDIRPSSSTSGLPIDLDHDAGAAAGWMKKLYVQPNADGGQSLWASVEWTPLGIQKLTDREYTMFSPEFCPKGYFDPEGQDESCDNVLIGGGLTNRPLFKDLQPIVASEKSDNNKQAKGEFDKIFLSASAKEYTVPTLEETRAKDVAELNDEERKLLADNASELTAEEQTKFGLKVEAPAEPVEVKVETPAPVPAEPVAASDKVVITAAEKTKLEADAAKGVEAHATLAKIQASDHVKEVALNTTAGFKVKADMKDKLVDFYVTASDTQKKLMDEVLENAQPLMASEDMDAVGSSSDPATAGSGVYANQIMDKASELIKTASEAGQTLSLGSAVSQVRKANPDLAKSYDEEIKEGN